MDTIGILTSMALQYGVPLDVLVSKFSHVRFEPSGFTKNPEIPIAKSLIDYIFRFLGAKFLSPDQHAAVGLALPDRQPRPSAGCAGDAGSAACRAAIRASSRASASARRPMRRAARTAARS